MKLIGYEDRHNRIPIYEANSFEEIICHGIANWEWTPSSNLMESIIVDIERAEQYGSNTITLELPQGTFRVICKFLNK